MARPKEHKRALPFHGKAIKFGEACVVVEEPANTFELDEQYHWFQKTKTFIPLGTILIPIQCFSDSWRVVTKCLVGGTGIVYLDIKTQIDRFQ